MRRVRRVVCWRVWSRGLRLDPAFFEKLDVDVDIDDEYFVCCLIFVGVTSLVSVFPLSYLK